MKILIVLILLFYNSLFSQTVEEKISNIEKRLKAIEDTLGFNATPTIDSLIAPTFEGIIMQSLTSDVLPIPYSPMYLNNGYFNLYVIKNGGTYRAQSVNGLNSWTYTSVSAPRGSVVFLEGLYYSSYHVWVGDNPYSHFSMSYNGINFNDIATLSYPTGEDRTILYNATTKEYYLYTRIAPASQRRLGFQKSSDFKNWTTPIEIIKTDATDGSLKRLYSMSVVKTPDGYYGLLNVYRLGDSGQDVEQVPPYTLNEHTLDCQLVYSADGINKWYRLNNRMPFIKRNPEVKQLLGIGSIIGENLIITTIESKRRHTIYDNSKVSQTGYYYYIGRYKISLKNLYKYRR